MLNWRGWLIVMCVANGVACSEADPTESVAPVLASNGSAGSDAGLNAPARPGAAPGNAEPEPSVDHAVARADAGAEAPRGEGAAANEGGASAGDPPGGLEPRPDGGLGEPGPVPAEAPDVALSFATDVHPIFSQRCGPCHTTQRVARHNVGGALPGAYADALALGQVLLARIDGGSMPPTCDGAPGSSGCLSVADVELVRRWIGQGSPP
jgi:hypothetical protein